jgi:type I restriction enzyme R subunit
MKDIIAAHLESAFESRICESLIDGSWHLGDKYNYDRDLGLDCSELFKFIQKTQTQNWERLISLHGDAEKASLKFSTRLGSELDQRGAIDVLRKGIVDLGVKFQLAYFVPAHDLTPENRERYNANRVTVTRQIKMSETNVDDSIDLVFFLNGIPVSTAEIKSQTAGQNVKHAIRQYRYDRKPNDLIFRSRSLVNFAFDENDVFMTTNLKGVSTTFLPFNKGAAGAGKAGGMGNPLDPDGEKTRYLWHEVLQRDNWLRILGSYIHVSYKVDEATGKKTGEKAVIFPRFHQWHSVEAMVEATSASGPGVNRLAQHSAGSGKSNTISWLAHRLSVLHSPAVIDACGPLASKGIGSNEPFYDKVIVVTDRRVLDQQLRDTVASFDHQPGSIVSVREDAGSKNAQLREALETRATRIIITTIQTFPVVAKSATELAGTRFAIIVDEAHSGQSGDTAKDLKLVLSGSSSSDALLAAEEFDVLNKTVEDSFEDLLEKSVSARGKAENITFFAFTATPKSRTLELFGEKIVSATGEPVYVASHQYSMRQAIEEQYILDVLKNYTTYKTYYKLANNLGAADLEVPKGKAASALARYASLHPTNLAQKAEIIVEHFRANTAKKIDGSAKAMVVTRSRLHAVRYKQAIDAYIAEKNYKDVRTLVAFSGTVFDPDVKGSEYTEYSMNVIKSSAIPEEFAKSYQVLVVAEKYQTGFDQPLLHTMYVDKKLNGISAVQTLSRLNRIHPDKEDTFVLDFVNDAEEIQEAFRPYYEETTSVPTDPNVLYNLQHRLMAANILHKDEMRLAVDGILKATTAGSSALKANTDTAVERWNLLDGESKIDFKSLCRNYVAAYSFLAQIVPFKDLELEELYYYTKMLERRLLLDNGGGTVDIDDSVVLTHLRTQIIAQNEDLSLVHGTEDPMDPAISESAGGKQEDETELLSRLIADLNERFGLNLTDADRIWFEQQQQHYANDPDLMEVARANDYDNFEMHFVPLVADGLIERHEANEDLFEAFFNQPDFQRMMTRALSMSLYNHFNPPKDGVIKGKTHRLPNGSKVPTV